MSLWDWLREKMAGRRGKEEAMSSMADLRSSIGPWQRHLAALCEAAFNPLRKAVAGTDEALINFGLMDIFKSGLRADHESLSRDQLIAAMPEDVRTRGPAVAKALQKPELRQIMTDNATEDDVPLSVHAITIFRRMSNLIVGEAPADPKYLRGYFLTLAEIIFAAGLLIGREDPAYAQQLQK